jgi:cholesterol transport system auxiliary component
MTELTMRRRLRAALLALALGALGGCGAVSALSGAAAPLDAYALTPLSGGAGGGGARHVVVETPAASGAIATDRILVTPTRLQAAYLPGARWIDPTPVMVQTLLVQSLQATGAFRLVSRTPLGLLPDTTVLTEIRAFQAEPGPPEGPAYLVRVALTLTLVREADGAILGARNVEASAAAGSATPLAVAAAFDAAMGRALREAVAFVAGGAGA